MTYTCQHCGKPYPTPGGLHAHHRAEHRDQPWLGAPMPDSEAPVLRMPERKELTRCTACGLPRAQPGEARSRMILLPVLVAVVEAVPGLLAPLARCWSRDDETCRQERQDPDSLKYQGKRP